MGNSSLPYEIVHCSSWDDDYNPEQLVKSSPGNQSEPSPVKCKGWQTPKCPEYPQDLIIHLLSGASRISKVQVLSHHFKIATKIDVYIGILKDTEDVLEDIAPDTPPSDEEDNMLIEFTRLGYVCFDNNARAQFRARELKSIKINADGEYVRLVIRNCHRNRLNTYNQVGILALNILGQPLHSIDKNEISSSNSSSLPKNHAARYPFDDNSILSSSTRRTSVSSTQSQISRLPSSSPAELELQQWTAALLQAEEEAVRDESYQIAKTYKFLGDKMERFTKILADLESKKRRAVEIKNYDEAEKIKDDIQGIKETAINTLKHSQIHITEDGVIEPLETKQEEEIHTEPPHQLEQQHYHHQRFESLDLGNTMICASEMTDVPASSTSIGHIQKEVEWQEDTQEMIYPPQSQEQHTLSPQAVVDPDSIPEPIMDEERIPYTLPIHIFGEDIVACILSIKVKCRSRGLGQIEKKIQSLNAFVQTQQLEALSMLIYIDGFIPTALEEDDDDDDDEMDDETRAVAHFVNATLMMIQEAVMDSREPIVSLAIATWHQLIDFFQQTGIEDRSVIEWTERAFSGLLKRTGDTNAKIKQAATTLVLVLVQIYHTPPFALILLFVCKPERMIHNYKEAKARVELVEATVTKLGVMADQRQKKAALLQVPLPHVMAFVVVYLNHGHEEVRQAAVKLVISISDQVGFHHVSSYIDETLRLSLTETVKKLVDKDPFYNSNSNTQTTTKRKDKPTTAHNKNTVSELRALTVVKPEKRSTLNNNRSVKKTTATSTASRNVEKKSNGTTTRPNNNKKAVPETARGNTKSSATSKPVVVVEEAVNENSVCIFCDEVNPEFNEDTLIKHYYNTCPVLVKCPMCQIITEISTLNEHMLVDCERRHLIKECTRCHQAIPVEQWLQHTLKQVCHDMAGSDKVHCPLCHVNIEPPNDEGWKLHLMTGEGCTKLKKSRSPMKKASQQPTSQTKKKTTTINSKR